MGFLRIQRTLLSASLGRRFSQLSEAIRRADEFLQASF